MRARTLPGLPSSSSSSSSPSSSSSYLPRPLLLLFLLALSCCTILLRRMHSTQASFSSILASLPPSVVSLSLFLLKVLLLARGGFGVECDGEAAVVRSRCQRGRKK